MYFVITLGRNDSTDSLCLHYQMGSSPIARKYFQLVSCALASGKTIDQEASSPHNRHRAVERARLVAAINGLLDDLRDEPAIVLAAQLATDVNQGDLNRLHAQMEMWTHASFRGDVEVRDRARLIERLARVNSLIHQLESCCRYRESRRLNGDYGLRFSLKFQLQEQEIVPLADDDYQHFVLSNPYGSLLLGYNTLGKNFVDAHRDDDLELIYTRGVRPQRTFSTDTIINFADDPPGRLAHLKTWWDEVEMEHYGYRWDDEKNALGSIPIGFWVPCSPFRHRTHKEVIAISDGYDRVNGGTFARSILPQ